MKTITYKYIADKTGVHIDTIFRAKRKGYCSIPLANKLNKCFGVNKLECINPDNPNYPWKDLKNINIE